MVDKKNPPRRRIKDINNVGRKYCWL